MNLVRKNNSNALFPSVMDELFRDWAGNSEMVKKSMPSVNIQENESGYELALAVPGMKKEDFNIEIDNDLLSISAEVKTEKTEEEKGKFTRREFSLSSFKRSFTLPETVNTDAINAAYNSGILTLTLPKKEEALPKAKRLIAIS
ncbi:Hsp20/alpha crystallin family protein [Flavobacterium litorale]|uniref:Hsp20/alpha crystallin family protein n=1 Tax=Flavobacterium litorale TaxID=2856519 RepID=A0ABX8V691_9FLAO|nr:Hsp20/alpha crystallin family protein [Flavobacterium litorale]QYJ68354.1 Hsp20/alpha crystallin family protein [Flavobacterium litorale]